MNWIPPSGVRTTMPSAFLCPKKGQARHEYRNAASTDIRLTFARFAPAPAAKSRRLGVVR